MADRACAIGIDLGGTNLKGIILDRAGKGEHLTRVPTEANKGGQQVLRNIVTLIDKLIEKRGGKEGILGAGLGSPGFVDEEGTVIGGAENLPGWKGTQVFAPVRERFGLEMTAGNDVTVTALAEYKYGAGRGVKNMVCLALGTGVGGGIVIDGHLYKGTHGMAGELGHISVETGGLLCNCGQRGCVEQYASATGVVNMARRFCAEVTGPSAFVDAVNADPESVTAKMVYDFVEAGDPIAVKVHHTAMKRLARACGIICNSFAPDRIVLGGGMLKSGSLILDEVARHVPKYCWADIWERCTLAAAECGEDAGVIGAAAMVFDEMPGG